jgi:hypothetical protein
VSISGGIQLMDISGGPPTYMEDLEDSHTLGGSGEGDT